MPLVVEANDIDIDKDTKFSQLADGLIVCTDALAFLKGLGPNTADLVFLDPPFNLGKKYGSHKASDDRIEEEEYLGFLKSIASESVRILKPGGSLFLYQVPKTAITLAAHLQKQDLDFRHWIAISMKNGFARGDYLYPAHYAMLYFSKGSPTYFKRPKIQPKRCRICGEYVKDYGGYKKYVADGVNLSDVWDDLSPVRHKSAKNRPSNELPIELLRRVVQIGGIEGGLLVDPFVGSGTSLVAASEAGMHYLACDREFSSCKIALRRLLTSKAP